MLPTLLLLLTALTSPWPNGAERCDVLPQRAAIEAEGWVLDCDPGFPNRGTVDGGQTWFPIWGWTDAEHRTVWVWPDEVKHLSDDAWLRWLLQHELGHVLHPEWDERTVDRWAWCVDPQPIARHHYLWQPHWRECQRLGWAYVGM